MLGPSLIPLCPTELLGIQLVGTGEVFAHSAGTVHIQARWGSNAFSINEARAREASARHILEIICWRMVEQPEEDLSISIWSFGHHDVFRVSGPLFRSHKSSVRP
jgi:hypothetical protein